MTQFTDPTYLESVYAALFAQIQTATFAGGIKINTWLRSLLVPDEVPPASQPAVVQVKGPMHGEQKEVFGPTKWTLTALLLIYLRADSTAMHQSPLPDTLTNYLAWGLQAALGTEPPNERQTLGGLVHHCWIEGQIGFEASKEQIVISVPVYILI